MKDVLGKEIERGSIVVIGRASRQTTLLFGIVLQPKVYHSQGLRVRVHNLQPLLMNYGDYRMRQNRGLAKPENMLVVDPNILPLAARLVLNKTFKEFVSPIKKLNGDTYPPELIESIKYDLRNA
jgi:hypothetical protein